MKYDRVEIRLDEEHQRKISELKAEYGSASEVIRRGIDAVYEEARVKRGKAIVRRMAEANLEEMPDPEELKRQIESAYDVPDPYRR
jgi:Arc/MetJ-type ribon-helix-helix transcriptional regulator